MELLEDGILAALAAVGLLTLLLLPLSALMRPRRALRGSVLLPCSGDDSARLEQTVRALEHARSGWGGFGSIVILDCGLEGDAAKAARLLSRSGRVELKGAAELLHELERSNGRTGDPDRHDSVGHLSE